MGSIVSILGVVAAVVAIFWGYYCLLNEEKRRIRKAVKEGKLMDQWERRHAREK